MSEKNPPPPAVTKTEERPARRRGRLTVAELHVAEKTPAWLHAAAVVLHEWDASTRLDVDIYKEALKAAARPNAQGHYEPHAPACPEHLQKALADAAKAREEAAEKAKKRAAKVRRTK